MRNGSSRNLNSGGGGGLRGKGRVRPEDVVEAASLATNWHFGSPLRWCINLEQAHRSFALWRHL